MLRILMHRHAKRVGKQGLIDESFDPEPARPVKADKSVCEAACLHLLHEYDVPFYYGMDSLCDLGSENAEQFLRLAAVLVDMISTKLVREKPPTLDATIQHKLLRDRAREFMRDWDFPRFGLVKRLVDRMAKLCLAVTLTPNAWLAPGANAYGVPQSEFEGLASADPELASVLHFGMAYKAFTIVPNYSCKNKEWCLFELGGIVALVHGLTTKRGGFIEGSRDELGKMLRSTVHEQDS
jgi:hypothetical protein